MMRLRVEDIRKAWRAHSAVAPIEPLMCFKAQGLVLGADTVLAPCGREQGGGTIAVDGAEQRLLTLLSSAYSRTIGEEALGHISRAAHRWNRGEKSLASVHLALTRLGHLDRPQEAARRLFYTDTMLAAGVEPDAIFSALGLQPPTRAVS